MTTSSIRSFREAEQRIREVSQRIDGAKHSLRVVSANRAQAGPRPPIQAPRAAWPAAITKLEMALRDCPPWLRQPHGDAIDSWLKRNRDLVRGGPKPRAVLPDSPILNVAAFVVDCMEDEVDTEIRHRFESTRSRRAALILIYGRDKRDFDELDRRIGELLADALMRNETRENLIRILEDGAKATGAKNELRIEYSERGRGRNRRAVAMVTDGFNRAEVGGTTCVWLLKLAWDADGRLVTWDEIQRMEGQVKGYGEADSAEDFEPGVLTVRSRDAYERLRKRAADVEKALKEFEHRWTRNRQGISFRRD